MDGTKTGLTVLPEVCAADKRNASVDKPPLDRFKPSSARLAYKSNFVLDLLVHYGEKRSSEYLAEFDKKLLVKSEDETKQRRLDPILLPWTDVTSRIENARVERPHAADALQEDLNLIMAHVNETLRQFQATAASNASAKPISKGAGGGSRFERQRKNYMLPVVASFARPISGIMVMSANEVERVKASYAYSLSNSNFAFCVAYATLCKIKSEASMVGGATSTRSIDEARAVPASVRKVFDLFEA